MSKIALKIHAQGLQLQPTPKPGRKMCGCFNCFTIFEASEVTVLSGLGDSPNCPNCGKDTVLTAATVPSLDQQLLREVNTYWFAQK